MMFKCPVCGDRHILQDNYDNQDYICLNTSNRVSQKIFQGMEKIDQLTVPMYPMNVHSTKVTEARAVTVLVGGRPDYRRNAERIGTLAGKNY